MAVRSRYVPRMMSRPTVHGPLENPRISSTADCADMPSVSGNSMTWPLQDDPGRTRQGTNEATRITVEQFDH